MIRFKIPDIDSVYSRLITPSLEQNLESGFSETDLELCDSKQNFSFVDFCSGEIVMPNPWDYCSLIIHSDTTQFSGNFTLFANPKMQQDDFQRATKKMGRYLRPNRKYLDYKREDLGDGKLVFQIHSEIPPEFTVFPSQERNSWGEKVNIISVLFGNLYGCTKRNLRNPENFEIFYRELIWLAQRVINISTGTKKDITYALTLKS